MATYAKGTAVSVDKTQGEIRKEVQRFGASHFSFAEGPGYGIVEFVVGPEKAQRHIRFRLNLPDKSDTRFWQTPVQKFRRSADDARKSWELACRESWRALLLLVKAKLAAVQAGIVSIEEEFLPHTVDPFTGQTVYEAIGAQISDRIAGRLPAPADPQQRPLRLPGPIEPTEIIEPS